MRRRLWVVLLALIVFSVGAAWLWWVKPNEVDMASYAPATSLLYLESNRPIAVVDAIVQTDAWRLLGARLGGIHTPSRRQWYQRFVRWTGIGPVQSVILARSQVAVVVTDLAAVEEGDTLNLRPEGALVIETHTMESRIRAPVEQALKRLAEATYSKPVSNRKTMDGVEFIEWKDPNGSRQIVSTIIGSLVIVGNSEHAVQSCLAVVQQRQPSLKTDPELDRTRLQLSEDQLLAFGYVPAANSGRLLSIGLPLLFGRTPGDSQFQQVATSSARKIFGSLAWGSRPFRTGIEDRYLISLQPAVIAQLTPGFTSTREIVQQQRVLNEPYSITYYKFQDPLSVWQSINHAISSQVDALSAIVFSSVLRSGLVSYGIDKPDDFLRVVHGDLITLRLDQTGENTMLIARPGDGAALRELLTKELGFKVQSNLHGEAEMFDHMEGEFAAYLSKDFVVLGSVSAVRRYSEIVKTANTAMPDATASRVTFFVPLTSTAPILTYTNDTERVRTFLFALAELAGKAPRESDGVEQAIAELPYSATETRLTAQGLERVTRSPLGQYSTLLPLLVSQQRTRTETGAPSK